MHTTHSGTAGTAQKETTGKFPIGTLLELQVTYEGVYLLSLVSKVVHFTLSGAIMGIQILRDSKLNLS